MAKRQDFTCAICGDERPKPFNWPVRDASGNEVDGCVECYKSQGRPTTLDAALQQIDALRAERDRLGGYLERIAVPAKPTDTGVGHVLKSHTVIREWRINEK